MKKLLVFALILVLCLSLAAVAFADDAQAAVDVESPEENPLGELSGAVSPQTGVADYTPVVCCIAVVAVAVLFGSVAYLKKAQ